MKRLICLALVLALLASVLAACGKLTQNPPGWRPSTESSQGIKPSVKSSKPSTQAKSEPSDSPTETQKPSSKDTPQASSGTAQPTKDNPQSTEPNTTQPTEPNTTQPTEPKIEDTEAPTEKVVMVWIPSSGSKYHKSKSCSGMKDPKEVSLEDAKDMGYTPCKRCYG